MAASSGGKMANLGEIHNNLRLPTPRGFVITAAAYKHFLEGSGLSDILADKLQNADVRDLVGLEAVSQELQDLIKQAAIPADLAASHYRSRCRFLQAAIFRCVPALWAKIPSVPLPDNSPPC